MKTKLAISALLILLGSHANASVIYDWIYTQDNQGTPTNAVMSLEFSDEAFAQGVVVYDSTNCHPIELAGSCIDPNSAVLSFSVRQVNPYPSMSFNMAPRSGIYNENQLTVNAILGNQYLTGSIYARTNNDVVAISGTDVMTITTFGSDGLGGGGCDYYDQLGCHGATGYFLLRQPISLSVPEPSSVLLILIGLIAAAGFWGRKAIR